MTGVWEGLEQVTDPRVFLGLLGLAGLVESFFPPFPGDTVLALGGFLAGRRGLFLLWPLLASWSGTFLAACLLYWAGRYGGRAVLSRPFFARLLPAPYLARLEEWFARYGFGALCVSRFIPVLRAGVALAAGIAGLSPGRAVAGLALGVAVFNSFLVAGGYFLGERWSVLAPFGRWVGGGIVLVACLVLACRWWRRRIRDEQK